MKRITGKVKIRNGKSTQKTRNDEFLAYGSNHGGREKRTDLMFIQKRESAELLDRWNAGCWV